MFSGFKLDCTIDSPRLHAQGELLYNKSNNEIITQLSSYISSNGSLDGTKITNDWFPEMAADIFISHSHNNKTEAVTLAGWLNENFGLSVFIDSCIWGNSIDLQKIVDNAYCRLKTGNYNYDARNYSTAHIHMILASALSQAINKAECLMFLKTPESICVADIDNKTNSPWIYFELVTSKTINRKLPIRRRRMIKKAGLRELAEDVSKLKIEYLAPLDHLVQLSNKDLNAWKLAHEQGQIKMHPLDILYNLYPTSIQNHED